MSINNVNLLSGFVLQLQSFNVIILTKDTIEIKEYTEYLMELKCI